MRRIGGRQRDVYASMHGAAVEIPPFGYLGSNYVSRTPLGVQPRLLYPARISFKYEGEIKSFTDKQKLREFSITKVAFNKC